jgi:hypothetical protein
VQLLAVLSGETERSSVQTTQTCDQSISLAEREGRTPGAACDRLRGPRRSARQGRSRPWHRRGIVREPQREAQMQIKALSVTSVVLSHGENLRASFGRPPFVGLVSLHQPISCLEAWASSLAASFDVRPAGDSHHAPGRLLGDERNGCYRLAPDGSIRWAQRALEVASNRLKWKCVRLLPPDVESRVAFWGVGETPEVCWSSRADGKTGSRPPSGSRRVTKWLAVCLDVPCTWPWCSSP